ncbi:Trafficking protein particle complex subunit 6B [Elsinoe australis]|uniref:Trafficking protein particle complex subunit 6B n=1 Tax=Elsinoe australis TaxID=40998 RepID=A0A2P7ZXW3_9PEZI|nr:Trafficking protein particle complex subunit 6B [Elsinoe australis]
MSRPSLPDDATAPKLAASAFDLLLIELVPMAYRLQSDLAARESELVSQASLLHLFPAKGKNNSSKRKQIVSGTSTTDGAGKSSTVAGTTAGAAGTVTTDAGGGEEEDEQVREAVFYRLDKLGYRVGQGLVERFAADQPRPTTHLEMIKFVCKDLWTRVFRKQIDNLKTNHRGTFVLTDARFQPLSRMSADRRLGPKGVEQAVAKAQAFLWFPCGVIRGALQGLGMNVTVNAESTDLPIATFQIRLVGAKP